MKLSIFYSLVFSFLFFNLANAEKVVFNQAFEAQLIENGADVNLTDEYGQTALMHALERGHTVAARELIENGADVVNLKSESGDAELMYASVTFYIKNDSNDLASE